MQVYKIRLDTDFLRELLHIRHPYVVVGPTSDQEFKPRELRGYEILVGNTEQPGEYGAPPKDAVLVTHARHTWAEVIPC